MDKDHRESHVITDLLDRWRHGDREAGGRLMDLVYGELHGIAAREMRREHGEHTLQTTAIVHEAYLRICRSEPIDWKDRAHFYAVAAQQLRRVLVDHARRRCRERRGGGMPQFSILDSDGPTIVVDERVLAVHEALTRLESLDSRAARAVELRFFGGLSIDETAAVIGVSAATVNREWASARAWLFREMSRPGHG